MQIRYNETTVQFCCEGRMPGGDVVSRFLIEQNEGSRRDSRREAAVYNTVQDHLHSLSVRTGLDYEIVRWGDPKDRTGWLAGLPFDD